MKYTKEERLVIGRRIYDGEISRYQDAEEYGIGEQTARITCGYITMPISCRQSAAREIRT